MNFAKASSSLLLSVDTILPPQCSKRIEKANGANKNEKNSTYYNEIRPALVILRILGRFPYRMTKSGVMNFSMFSIPAIYSYLFFVTSSVLGIWSNRKVFYEKIQPAEDFATCIFWSVLIIFSLQAYLVPVTYWNDSSKVIRYFKEWEQFESLAQAEGLKLRATKRVHLGAYMVIPGAATFLLLETFLLTGTDHMALIFIHYFPIIGGTISTLVIWSGTLYELSSMSKDLASNILQSKNRYNLSFRRYIVVKLNHLAYNLGHTMGWTMTITSLIHFISFVTCVYGSMSFLTNQQDRNEMLSALVIGATFNLMINCFICETSHRTTDIMKNEFTQTILKIDATIWPETCIEEIKLLLKGMVLAPPVIELNGYVTCNRHMFTRLIANAVSYLVVLVQFNLTPNSGNTDAINLNTTIRTEQSRAVFEARGFIESKNSIVT